MSATGYRRWVEASICLLSGVLMLGHGCGGSSGSGGTGGASGGGGATAGGTDGGACHAAGTLQVTASGTSAYVIDGLANPDLTLCRGATYVFAVDAPGHPFFINLVQGTGTGNAYSQGVTGNGTTSGDVTFVVPADAPGTLYYNCSIHPAMTGTLHLVD